MVKLKVYVGIQEMSAYRQSRPRIRRSRRRRLKRRTRKLSRGKPRRSRNPPSHRKMLPRTSRRGRHHSRDVGPQRSRKRSRRVATHRKYSRSPTSQRRDLEAQAEFFPGRHKVAHEQIRVGMQPVLMTV